MKLTVRNKSELPPDPNDRYAAIVAGFNDLTGDEVLFIEPDGEVNNFRLGQLLSAIKKRLEKDSFEVRRDLAGGGLWVMPKRPRPANGGSAAAAPLDRPSHP